MRTERISCNLARHHHGKAIAGNKQQQKNRKKKINKMRIFWVFAAHIKRHCNSTVHVDFGFMRRQSCRTHTVSFGGCI